MFHGTRPRVLVLGEPGILNPAEVSPSKTLARFLWHWRVELMTCGALQPPGGKGRAEAWAGQGWKWPFWWQLSCYSGSVVLCDF